MSLTLFMYHRILPMEYKESISADMFRRQLDYIQAHYKFLPANQAESYIKGDLPAKGSYAALSFDDAWTDNLLFADDVLKERGLSSLLAVSAGTLRDGPVRKTESDEVLYRSMADSQAAARAGELGSYLNNEELKQLQTSGRWQLEVHGTKHELGDGGASILSYPQNGMDETSFRRFLTDDLENCRTRLTGLTGRQHHILFWPWGHYSSLSVSIARDCGFDIQFTVAKGCIKPGDERSVLPRIGVPPRWQKFVRNCVEFRYPLFAAIHDCFHKEKVCFDDRLEMK